ncbi:potassium transporter Kup [Oryzihumus leptocrescens]|uniref:Probable potassium transport system protein Kup n=1 Tax=Oryzihumus leptocrescens TaxID=297536 RepID=A0A542ZNF4_9MICO|nr:potassium transporter Kup [Oryzihumus leptocrescens]TQL61888.1 KUP system potassium uptake protein [Oryzihumus leptocrescens]
MTDLTTAASSAGADTASSAPEAPPTGAPKPVGAALLLAALGVVFGDIGTSPLYALQTVFSLDHGIVRPTAGDVYGVISLMFWSVTLIVSAKYVMVLMRADNDGEGGVMALAALARRLYARRGGRTGLLMALGILGVSLFYGDSVITPAISVLSAVEGLKVAAPGLAHLVVPVAAVILTGLFAAQRFGTGKVGTLFGPVTLLWFAALAAAGIPQVVAHPNVLAGLSPTYAVAFVAAHPGIAFVAMGAVVLVITGAEALYADMGHFGRMPILRAWFFVVFPALTLNYLGQAALILHHPGATTNPFFLLLPGWSQVPMVVLATAATVIASQAVISGAFSLSRQAMQLGMLPALRVRQTSEHEAGQIYLPGINGALFVGVLALMFAFRSSARLATAYGVSVTGALVIDTILLLLVARVLWDWPAWKLAAAGIGFGGIELTFLAGNLSKVAHGGWLPLLIAACVFTVMTTWQKGRAVVATNRRHKEGPLQEFIDHVHEQGLPRVPGTAVFPHPDKETTPLAMRATVEHNHVLHEHVIVISATSVNVPHVPPAERLTVDDLGYEDDGILHLSVRYGFADHVDLPAALRQACADDLIGPGIDIEGASYFLSRGTITLGREKMMATWRKRLFAQLARHAADPAEYFGLPVQRIVTMGSHVTL